MFGGWRAHRARSHRQENHDHVIPYDVWGSKEPSRSRMRLEPESQQEYRQHPGHRILQDVCHPTSVADVLPPLLEGDVVPGEEHRLEEAEHEHERHERKSEVSVGCLQPLVVPPELTRALVARQLSRRGGKLIVQAVRAERVGAPSVSVRGLVGRGLFALLRVGFHSRGVTTPPLARGTRETRSPRHGSAARAQEWRPVCENLSGRRAGECDKS